jgi:hypothetical protein
VNRADHHGLENGRIAHLQLDRIHFPSLDRVEPFVAVHHERTARPSADKDEVAMDERAKPFHVLGAQSVAPFALEPFDHLAIVIGHASPLGSP